MEEIVNLIGSDYSPSAISDMIKDVLFAKAAQRIDSFRPEVASGLFGEEEFEDE